MELDWSERSPHIRTLFHPWKSQDGYYEVTITAAETRLGIPLPPPLRTFYRAWGQRREMAWLFHCLVAPDQLEMRSDELIFCHERDGSCHWGVRRESLEESNPPVAGGYNYADTSHPRLSDFFDDLTYMHAFNRGAIHGGWGEISPRQRNLQEFQKVWLSHHWHRVSVDPMVLGLVQSEAFPEVSLYVRDGQALNLDFGLAATNSIEALEEIGQVMQFTWQHRW